MLKQLGRCRLATGIFFVYAAAMCQAGADNAGQLGDYPVGYTETEIVYTGSLGEARPIRVQMWYPSDRESFHNAPAAVYRSSLWGATLVPGTMDPIAFQVVSNVARYSPDIDRRGPAFPVILSSHGSGSEPMAQSESLEQVASHGFVVIAPSHEGNTADDNRVDFINAQAQKTVLPCPDYLPAPCADGSTKNHRDRVRDISAILDTLPGYFGHRADFSRVGLLGWSRGGTTAVGAAAGSSVLGIAKESRIRSVMGVATPAAILQHDLASITVPTLLVAGTIDEVSPAAVSQSAYELIGSAHKALVLVPDATHRGWAPTLCDELQNAGAIAMSNPRAIIESVTVQGLLGSPTFGTALDFCPFHAFVSPVDIRPLVESISGVDVTPDTVPRKTSVEDLKRIWTELAVSFFGATLADHGSDGRADLRQPLAGF